MKSVYVSRKSKTQSVLKDVPLDQISSVLDVARLREHNLSSITDRPLENKVRKISSVGPDTRKQKYSTMNWTSPNVVTAEYAGNVSAFGRVNFNATIVKQKASISDNFPADTVAEDTQTERPPKSDQFSRFNVKNLDCEFPSDSKSKKRKGSRIFHEISNKKWRITASNQLSQKMVGECSTKDGDRQLSDDDYASHFSSDSDAAANEVTHLDRSTQRERRRVQNERLRRTVFVGNLPSGVSRKCLKQLFNRTLRSHPRCAAESCYVESVRFRGVIPSTGSSGKLARKRAVVQGEHSVGVSETLLAYVVLSSKAGIPAALSLNGHWLSADPHKESLAEDPEKFKEKSNGDDTGLGRFIRVDVATKDKSTVKQEYCVFLGNLAFDVMEDEVRNSFSRFGQIENVRLIRDRQTGAVKGIGYVQFEDVSAVSLAIRASGSISVRNRPVRVQECRLTGAKETKKKKCQKWEPKTSSVHRTEEKSRISSISSDEAKHKIRCKLDHIGRIKGITLPSNLQGSLRERYLNKRLIKKRKRQLRRQKMHTRQSRVAVMGGEIKGTLKNLKQKKKDINEDRKKLKEKNLTRKER